MKLKAILEKYDFSLLDQICADKIDESVSIRLPSAVIIQEIVSALSSLSYISGKITFAKPPAFAFLDLLLQFPDNSHPIDGFREKVLEYSSVISAKAAAMIGSHSSKNYQLYTKILNRAWESDRIIDKSESIILDVVKNELGIWEREHFVLQYHPDILKLWDFAVEYQAIRNLLLTTGIVLMDNNIYLIADEVATQLRKTMGMEIKLDSFKRLTNGFTREELQPVLENFELAVSGSKNEFIQRIVDAYIPPSVFLETFQVDDLREFCRKHNIRISGSKATVINNVIEYFDRDQDLQVEEPDDSEPEFPLTPEIREIDEYSFGKILLNLSNQQLYDVLNLLLLPTSGTKEEKATRIKSSPWSERSILTKLRKDDLSGLCRRFGVSVYGSKQEIIDRVLSVKFDLDTETTIPMENVAHSELLERKQTAEPQMARDVTVAQKPALFDEIAKEFPDLDVDEQIVLAIIKESKSLSEQELGRVVLRYNLGWFLLKAKMTELMTTLMRRYKLVIKIKSVQSTNIYQWADDNLKSSGIIEKKSARDIIDALRHGVVPKNNLDLLIIGQQNAKDHFVTILSELDQKKSSFKFIRGQYGSGKTFFCSWLKEYALSHEFTVSFLNISHDQPLSDLPIFYSGLINGLRIFGKDDASGLVDILESWLLNVHSSTVKIEGSAAQNIDPRKMEQIVERRIESEISRLNDVESGISQALRSFYRGKIEGDQELVSNTVAWLNGSRSLSSQALKQIGVKGFLEANNVFPRIRALLEIIHGAGYKGLMILVDELELVRKFPHIRQREQAFETLRLIIDESGRNALPDCLIVFTGTDEFFEDDRFGLKSYSALAERILTPMNFEGYTSMRQPIINLESLDQSRLKQVIDKIKLLYSIAYNCDTNTFAGDDSVEKLVHNWTQFGNENISRKPRPVLREFIQMLDLCEENRGLTINDLLKENDIVQTVHPKVGKLN
jgi:hypothetical protein